MRAWADADGSLRAAKPLVVTGFLVSFVLIGGGIDTVGVFINAIAQANGWARSALSLGVSVGAVVAALATPLVGMSIDRFGVRVPMTVGVVALAGGFVILVEMQAPWHWVAANLFLGTGFAACALLPLTVAISVCVRERRALALGIAAAGASGGALLFAPLLQLAVEGFGWRGAYLAMGSVVVATPLPLIAFVLPRGRLPADDPPEDANPRGGTSFRELRRPGMLPLAGVMVLPGLATFAVSVHLVPYLTDFGVSARIAAVALGATVGVSAIGKVFGGLLADQLGALQMLRVALVAATGSLLLLPAAASPAALVGFVLLYGLALGTYVAVVPALARGVLGSARFGTLFGALQLGGMLAAALGPIAAGLLFDATGHYWEANLMWVGAMLGALVIAVAMSAPAGELASFGEETPT
jgi:MFS family permease